MIKKLQAMKKNKKGFTLVELIVVLVILAILAALLLPTLTKYIDQANEMKVESACRMAVMAAKAETGKVYGNLAPGATLTAADFTATQEAEAKALAEMPDSGCAAVATVTAAGVVTKVVYTTATHECTYTGTATGGSFAVVPKTGGTVDGSFTFTM